MRREFSTKNSAASVGTSARSLVGNTPQLTVSDCCLWILPYSEVFTLIIAKHLQQKASFSVTKMVKHNYG